MCEMTKEKYIALLKKWDDEYYNNGQPSVVDTTYDRIREAFKAKYPRDPYFNGVGVSVKFEKITIPFVMGGLDKHHSDTIEGWIAKRTIIASQKLDGNSIGITWVDGEMTFACSRGTSNEGQNIIAKAKYFVPAIPAIKGRITLRGEAFLEGDAYKELGYQNRRNGTTGIIRKDTIIPAKLRKLSVMFYEVVEAPKTMQFEHERMNYIQKTLGLRTPEWGLIAPNVTVDTVSLLQKILADAKATANYDIDGLVLTVDNSLRENVSLPQNKVAFKVNTEAEKCKVTGIEWNVTRLGKIAPVICIEPTTMGGVTVHRASGFNAQYIESEGIDKGAMVGVVRSGDVIPYVTEVFKTVKANIPTKCPSCNAKLKRNDIDVICVNDNCTQKSIYNVAHYFKTIGANFITDRTIEMMGITTIEEAYKLTVKDLEKREGIGSKKAELLISEIKKTLTIKPEKLLDAFGMLLIGTRHSKTLLSKFSFDELFTVKDIDMIGLGEVTSQTFIDNIGKYKSLYKFLQKQGLTFIKEKKIMSKVSGLKFAVTGKGNLKRKDYEEMAENAGAVIKSMSRDTDYLVTDDTESGSAKNKAAQKFGTKIISYAQFEKMLRG